MKKIYVVVEILLILTASSVFATGSRQEGSTQAGTPTVDFIHIWPEHQETMETSVRLIQDRFGFNINLSVVPWNQIVTTVQVALTSGDMYDVFFEWGSFTAGYVQMGALLNLQPYFNADPSWRNSFISDSVFEDNGFLVNNQIHGIPFRGTGSFMIYNRTLFNQRGYAVPNTQEELVTLMNRMVADGVIPIATAGMPHGGMVEYVRRVILDYSLLENGILNHPEHRNGRMIDYRGLRGQSAEITRDWYNRGYFGRTPLGVMREEAQTLFFQGGVGMLWVNNNELMDLRNLERQSGFQIDSFQWPKPATANVTIGYAGMNDGFAVWSGTRFPDQAVELLKGLTMPEVQRMWGDRAFSIMPGRGINYSDPLLVKWADEFSNMTRFPVHMNYTAGTQDNDVADVFVDFLLNPRMTGADYEASFMEIRRASITHSN